MSDKITDPSQLTEVEKGAIILALTKPSLAAEIVAELSPVELRQLIAAFQRLENIDKEVIDSVIQEFIDTYERLKEFPPIDTQEFIKRIIDYVPPSVKEVLENLLSQPEIKLKLQHLEALTPKQLATLLRKEHPQIIAVILALLTPSKAARVLKEFPSDLRLEVVKRMATLESIPADRIKVIAESFLRELKEFVGEDIKIDGTKQVATILTSLDKYTAEEILTAIESENPELAEKIRDRMFTFEDIVKLDDKDILEILKAVDKQTLAVALKDAPREILDKFLRNMSKRAAQIFVEDMEAMGKVKKSEIYRARRQIVKIIKRLIEQGIISYGEGEEESEE
ncbi:MAG TPA: flagellar motor switch protein FliG [Aquificales bacterium]|nr:flagellar motor switch protein FliG [Aquificales bacterium]